MQKNDRRRIDRAINHLTRALTFVRDSRTHICREYSIASNEAFTNQTGTLCVTPIDKEFGSDLTGIQMGLDELFGFLNDVNQRKNKEH